jgi:hypothetical protein
MRIRRSVLRGLLIAISLSLFAAGPAGARVPKFANKLIVTGTSIGGVEVGMTKKQAVGVWGHPDECLPFGESTWCNYKARSSKANNMVQPFAGFYVRSGKVVAINLDEAENAAIDPKVKKLKTRKHIGLASTLSAARKAYNIPHPGNGGEAGESRGLYKQKRRCTLFYAPEQPYSDIQSIVVGKCSAKEAGF